MCCSANRLDLLAAADLAAGLLLLCAVFCLFQRDPMRPVYLPQRQLAYDLRDVHDAAQERRWDGLSTRGGRTACRRVGNEDSEPSGHPRLLAFCDDL